MTWCNLQNVYLSGYPVRLDQDFNYFKWEGLWTIGKLRGKQKIMQIYLIAMFRIIFKDCKLYLEITSKYTKNIKSHFKQQNMLLF
jgi:hypothetical protein